MFDSPTSKLEVGNGNHIFGNKYPQCNGLWDPHFNVWLKLKIWDSHQVLFPFEHLVILEITWEVVYIYIITFQIIYSKIYS